MTVFTDIHNKFLVSSVFISLRVVMSLTCSQCAQCQSNIVAFVIGSLYVHTYLRAAILCSVCREQWIRAKYDRKEFVLEATDDERPYTIGKQGTRGSHTLTGP